MEKYDVIKEIGSLYDKVESLEAENEMLKKSVSPRTTTTDCVNLEEVLGKAVIARDYKNMVANISGRSEDDDFYVRSSYLNGWITQYPNFGYYGSLNEWLEAVGRGAFNDSEHILDNFTLPELKGLFKQHLIAIYKYGRKLLEKKDEKNDN